MERWERSQHLPPPKIDNLERTFQSLAHRIPLQSRTFPHKGRNASNRKRNTNREREANMRQRNARKASMQVQQGHRNRRLEQTHASSNNANNARRTAHKRRGSIHERRNRCKETARNRRCAGSADAAQVFEESSYSIDRVGRRDRHRPVLWFQRVDSAGGPGHSARLSDRRSGDFPDCARTVRNGGRGSEGGRVQLLRHAVLVEARRLYFRLELLVQLRARGHGGVGRGWLVRELLVPEHSEVGVGSGVPRGDRGAESYGREQVRRI